MERCGSYLKSSFLCVFVLALMLSSTPGFGATIRVPADYQLIQTAIDAASDGDTVLVDDGTYKGTGNKNLSFRNKAITVKSENGPQNCIIDCEGKGRGFSFNGVEAESVISGFTITNCQGGISCRSASPIINNCIIKGNSSYSSFLDGAGISCYKSSPTITNSIISDNSATSFGGGIYGSATITNSTISGNSAWNGGAIYGYGSDSDIKISNSHIMNNSSGGTGGAIYARYGSDLKISNSRIMNNSSRSSGGAIYAHSVNITNSVISGNSASYSGAGIYGRVCSSLIITNSTFSNNTAGVSAGAIFCEGGIATITNSILWGDSLPEVSPSRDSFAVTYSDVQGGHIGTGNIDADPQFVGNGDYHLTSSSPCIDAGTSEEATDQDIDGDSRPQGAGYDMGADEYSGPEPCFADFSASLTRGVAPLTVNFTDQSTGKIDSWNWDFGDGSTSNEQNPSHIYNNLGCYTVALTVAGAGGSDNKTLTDYIKVGYPAKAMPWLMLLLDDDK